MFRVVYPKLFQNYSKYQGIELNDAAGPTVAFEAEIPKIPNSMFWLSYTKILKLPALASVPASSGLTVASYPEDSGDFDLACFHVQANDINKSGLDCFFTVASVNYDPSSQGTVFTNGYEVGLWGDNVNGNLGESQDGYALYTGIRYKLPFEGLKNPSIGLEYNHGSEHWNGLLSAGSGDLISKLGVNGDAYELYYIQPIDKKHMFCRIGGVYMDYDYYNPMLFYGSQTKSDMSITNLYFLMDVRF